MLVSSTKLRGVLMITNVFVCIVRIVKNIVYGIWLGSLCCWFMERISGMVSMNVRIVVDNE